jgi:hypothetical protein
VDGATKTAEIHNEDGRRFSESSAMSIEAGNNFVQPQHAPHSHCKPGASLDAMRYTSTAQTVLT